MQPLRAILYLLKVGLAPPQSLKGGVWVLGFVWWLLKRQERPPLFHRKLLPADVTSVQLSRGRTHYLLEGPAEASSHLVVLVHGFVGSKDYFDPLVSALVASGRRVLRYDNYGRGGSEWDGSPQNERLFAGQLCELLQVLGVHETVDLVGYSMGGAIAASFAHIYPQNVASLCLLSPAGCASTMNTPTTRLLPTLLQLPGLPGFIGNAVVSGIARAKTFGREWLRTDSDRFREQFYSSVKRAETERSVLAAAAASTLQYFPMGGCSKAFAAIGAECLFPVLVLWAELDGLCPIDGCDELEVSIPRAVIKRKPGYRHCFAIEMAEEVCEDMLSFYATSASSLS